MASCPSWVSNLAIDYKWESTICILDPIHWTLVFTFWTAEVRVLMAETTLSNHELIDEGGGGVGWAYLWF